MSYILDALKKSERKRAQGTVPDILTAQEAVYYGPKKRRLWPYLVIAAFLVNALAVAWFVPWKSKKSDTVTESGAVTKLALEKPDVVSDIKDEAVRAGAAAVAQDDTTVPKAPAEAKPAHSGNVARPRQLPAVEDEVQKKVSEFHKPWSDARVVHDTPLVASPEVPGATAPAEPKHLAEITPIPNKVYTLSELPLSLQQKLPSFGISVFLYSDDPGSRMVKINNKMLREGDFLSEGLKLEEIDQNSLILSYQNFRFRVGLK
jgi:general secretion pathway protein B